MKRKNLLELELSIPNINLLDSRTLLGGMGYSEEPAWVVELPDVVVTANPEPEFDHQDPPDPLDYDIEDYVDHEGGNGGVNQGYGASAIDVKVQNGYCVIGSIAAAIQAIHGGSATDAITQATNALNAIGVNTTPENGGISVAGMQIAQALTSLNFTVDTPTDNIAGHHIADWFSNGGYGIGHIGGSPSHDFLITGFNSSTMMFDYYESVTGEYGQKSILELDRGNNPNNALVLFK